MGDQSLKHVCSLLPITALVFLDDRDDILLSGEGPILRVFSVAKHAVLAAAQVFKSQTIHGIISQGHEHAYDGPRRLVIWGGFQVRILHLVAKEDRIQIHSGPKLEAPGWVLDGRFAPSQVSEAGSSSLEAQAALVTARNGLLLLQIPREMHGSRLDVLSASRYSILYSAHIRWVAVDRILVASGTAFGEIIIWSCTLKQLPEKPLVCQHQTLRGHEGSVFGVNISEDMSSPDASSGRMLLASCSDDRTIRIWDISIACSRDYLYSEYDDTLQLGPHETGFHLQDQAMLEGYTPRDMLTIAWGHASRIWGIRFVRHGLVTDKTGLGLLSFGEDATCQQWNLSWSCKQIGASQSCHTYSYALEHKRTRSYHAGRNIWSMATTKPLQTNVLVATGGADGKIACFIVNNTVSTLDAEHSVEIAAPKSLIDTSSAGPLIRDRESDSQFKDASLDSDLPRMSIDHNLNLFADGKKETAPGIRDSGLFSAGSDKDPMEFKFFRSYSLMDERRLLAITDAGSILVITCRGTGRDNMTTSLLDIDRSPHVVLNQSAFTYVQVGSSDAFRSHSIISTCRVYEISFLAVADGVIYYFLHKEQRLGRLGNVSGKVSNMLCKGTSDSIHIAISCVQSSNLTYWTCKVRTLVDNDNHECPPERSREIELVRNAVITSMTVLDSHDLLILGSRAGAVLIYDLIALSEGFPQKTMSATASFKRIHSEDAVTSISSLSNAKDGLNSPSPLILTTGRNGTFAIHKIIYNRSPLDSTRHIDMITVHELSVAVCPTIEGAYFNESKHLVIYGFLSKHFIVWNASTQSEVFTVECGGVHRVWNFLPTTHGGRFVWTKASKVYLHIQTEMAHRTLQHGGHGREIKAMSISPPFELAPGNKFQLIATGAEDTKIRISVYWRLLQNCEPDPYAYQLCDCHRKPFTEWSVAIINRHTTGIQALEWSPCGNYLFSSGGCEEFFVWKVQPICVEGLDVGITCEAVCPKQSEFSDSRITSFCTSMVRTEFWNTKGITHKFLISMAYSDSSVRVFEYDCINHIFTLLVQGKYRSCSITNIHHVFFDRFMNLCTTGSDGYLAWWNMTQPLHDKGILTEGGHLEEFELRESEEAGKIGWQERVFVHQNSVSSMSMIPVNSRVVIVLTGGDDGVLSVTRCQSGEDGSLHFSRESFDLSHVAITSIATLPSKPRLSGVTGKTGPDTGTQLHRYRFAATTNNEQLSILELNTSEEGERIYSFRKHATAETFVPDISSLGVLEHVSGGPLLIMCGIGMGVWRLR